MNYAKRHIEIVKGMCPGMMCMRMYILWRAQSD
jgi:hypothetical protein